METPGGVFSLHGQEFKYAIEIDTVAIPQMGGIQSFSVGQWNGYWLIIGGRLDGLHRRQPWATFDEAGHNRDLIVLSPEQKTVFPSASIATSTGSQSPSSIVRKSLMVGLKITSIFPDGHLTKTWLISVACPKPKCNEKVFPIP